MITLSKWGKILLLFFPSLVLFEGILVYTHREFSYGQFIVLSILNPLSMALFLLALFGFTYLVYKEKDKENSLLVLHGGIYQ